ncbi:helix-turn-helix transcriptional regulator [Nocardioides sp. HB32]
MAGLRSVPMVGRDAPLADLLRLAADAAAGRPRVAVVLGEAGIGKTRLLDEVSARLQRNRAQVGWGSCSVGAAGTLPLAPIREVLEDLHRILGPRMGRLAGASGQLAIGALVPRLAVVGDASNPDAPVPSQAQLFDVVARLLRDAGRARLLVIVVEDVHWADETSRDLLDFLARSLRDERILLLLSARTDDPAFTNCQPLVAELTSLRHGLRLELLRLSAEEIATQVAALRQGARPSATELARMTEITGGIPLLVEEVVDADLADVGGLADRLLGHRLARLSPDARAVVDAAAVAAFAASADELASAVPEVQDFDAAFAATVSAGVLVRRGEIVRFRHELLREAALARILPQAERALHRRWSGVLGDNPAGLGPLIAAARHRKGAGDAAGTLVAYVRAADAAQRLSAYAEQKQLLVQATEIWPAVQDAEALTGTNLVDVYGDAGWATYLTLGPVEEAQRLIDVSAKAMPADASPHRKAMHRLLWHRTRASSPERLSPDELLACVADVSMDPPSEDAMLACLEATDAHRRLGQMELAASAAQQAVAVADALGRPELLARALAGAAHSDARLGETAAAAREAQQAVTAGELADDLFVHAEVLQCLVDVQKLCGEDSLDIIHRLLTILGGDRPGPLSGWWGIAHLNHADTLIELGRWDEAQAALALVLGEDLPEWVLGEARRLADHLSVWRDGHLNRADGEPPRPTGESLVDPDLNDLLAVCLTDADIEARLGHLASARVHLAAVLGDDRLATYPGFVHLLLWVAARVEAELAASGTDPATSDGDWVIQRIQHLLSLVPPRNRQDHAYAAHALADLERRGRVDTPELWAGVVDAWRKVNRPFPLATALVRSGAAFAAAGRTDEAGVLLREAHDIAEQLGARPLSEEAATVARAAHLRMHASASHPGTGLGLTPRELDVLRLVAEGASNPVIATTLVISPKTASVHVSNILAKLGVANRGEAAAIAHRAGLV